jgi:TPP-dependent pyruvate/acetoin dehydrogenase alpha subunit
MPRTKLIDGIRHNLTAEEEAIRDAEEKAWSDKAFDRAIAKLREKRNKFLVETDWMANSDVTMSDDWKTYRQALRDITSGLDTIEKVNTKLTVDNNTESETYGKYINFPTKPE